MSFIVKRVFETILTFALVFVFLGLGRSGEAAASGSGTFRCGHDMVSLGDSMADVMLRCGEPTYRHETGVRGKARTVVRKSSERSQGGESHHSEKAKRTARRTNYKEQVTERWYYNRGSNDFVYRLSFEGGTLTKIDQGKRGK
ncbi:MAG: hypothetical protein A4E70_00981 [Syntrophus sp. PtaU1.Bin005]|jgi:ElaB/YqjD/DUF883 family membrane-anchored ribosome-binding protein|uniref:DUF2845 domain-containing protein n=1 Tax=Syntrophus buswellii TaxID=43774 RepID=UPI0009CD9D36|nr:MAG: hypothetical protein A4E69_00519 [Syntrophus sp. PtaB.Bin138]OPY81858.1 MAG: hypothetical protein A4E70_00981 [Syntrophus sp. PtaU1.Bin005]